MPLPTVSSLHVIDIIRLPITDQAHVCKTINRHRLIVAKVNLDKKRRAAYMRQYYRERNYDRR